MVLASTLLVACSLAANSPSPWWQRIDARRIAPDPDRTRAAALMRHGRSLGDVERAAELLERSLSKCEDDGQADGKLCLEMAQALNAIMRIKTHSNTLHITKMVRARQ